MFALFMFFMFLFSLFSYFFFFNDTATTEIYTLSLHDALPIYEREDQTLGQALTQRRFMDEANVKLQRGEGHARADRKSTRLNSSHGYISYAVFCLKKKKKQSQHEYRNVNYE